MTYKAATIGLDAYLTKTEGPLLQIVKKAFSVTVRRLIPSRKRLQDSETNLGSQTPSVPTEDEATTIYAKQVKKKANSLTYSNCKKPRMQGNARKVREESERGRRGPTEHTLATKKQWTESRDRTRGLIIAARDQSRLATRSYHHRIISDETDLPLDRKSVV